MLKRTSLIAKLVGTVLCLSAVLASCCDGDVPNSVGLGVTVVSKEDYDPKSFDDMQYFLDNIVVTLRNDTISDGIIKEKLTYSGSVDFTFSSSWEYKDRAQYKDWLFVTDEVMHTIGGETDYYLVINDTKSARYNAGYETREIRFTEEDRARYRYEYLPQK